MNGRSEHRAEPISEDRESQDVQFWEPLVLIPRPEVEPANVLTKAAYVLAKALSRDHRQWVAALCFGVRDETGAIEPDESDFFPDTRSVKKWVERFREQTRDHPPAVTLAALLPPMPSEWNKTTIAEAELRNELACELGVALFERGTADRGGFATLSALVSWIRERSQKAAPRQDVTKSAAETNLREPPKEAAKFARQPAHIEDFDSDAFAKRLSDLNAAPWWQRES